MTPIYGFSPPPGVTKAEVPHLAGKRREEAGDYNVADKHLAGAREILHAKPCRHCLMIGLRRPPIVTRLPARDVRGFATLTRGFEGVGLAAKSFWLQP